MGISMDKKYKTREGRPVRILCVDRVGNYPVVGLLIRHYENSDLKESIISWTACGEVWKGTETIDDLIEVSPYADFKIDDKVLVKRGGETWFRRYFAGVSDKGLPQTFISGATSFSSDGEKVDWTYCKKYEPSDSE